MESETDAGYRRPYLDTSVHVADIQNEAGPARCRPQILRAAEFGDLTIVASTLVIAELVHASGRPVLVTPAQDEAIERRFLNGWTELVELDVAIAIRARRIAREHGLKPADAVHVAHGDRGRRRRVPVVGRPSLPQGHREACMPPAVSGRTVRNAYGLRQRPGTQNGGEDGPRA